MTPFEVYCDYIALKQHFTTPSYDYQKYGGRMRLKQDTYEKRRDRYCFEKIAKHRDPHSFMLANFAQNNKVWVGELARSDDAQKEYESWAKRNQAFTYNFTQELDQLDAPFDANFLIVDSTQPPLLTKFLAGSVSLETLCALLYLTGAKSDWDRLMKYDVVWNNLKFRLEKYLPFLNFDEEKLKKILIDKFSVR